MSPPSEGVRDRSVSDPLAWFGNGFGGIRRRVEAARFTRFDFFVALGFAVLLYLVITATAASRHLWHDELFTYYIAKAPTLSKLWQDLRLDLNPPLSYLAVRGSLALFGDHLYATRIPSIVTFLIGSLCLCWLVSRRLRPIYGLLAMLVFWSTPFLYYATEARPYGLILGFFGIALLAWQRATESRRNTTAVIVLALSITGMMFTHFFAPFYVGVLCFAELVRGIHLRKVNWPIWTALLLPGIIPFAFLRAITGYEKSIIAHAFEASPGKIVSFYKYGLSPEAPMLLLAVVAGFFVGFRREGLRADDRSLMRAPEAALILGLLSLPIALNLILMRVHGAFFERYSAPTSYAFALVIVFLLAAATGASRAAAMVSCFVVCAYVVANSWLGDVPSALFGPEKGSELEMDRFSKIEQIRPELPLVAASGLTFLEMDRYAGRKTISRLFYLTDTELAIRYAHATIFESFGQLKTDFPIRGNVEAYGAFVAQHRQFLILGTPDYPEDWLIPQLLHIHAKLIYLGDLPGPYKDHQLYEVTMPGA